MSIDDSGRSGSHDMPLGRRRSRGRGRGWGLGLRLMASAGVCLHLIAASAASVASVAHVAALQSQAPAVVAEWKDASPHQSRLLQASTAVRLEVLDWGGRGRPIVLLAGGGDTAHVYDDFAPKLTDSFHVYGITRRGFGGSEFSESEVGPDRLGDDVLAVIDALALKEPVLVGHSLGGAELSAIANRQPTRVAGLIYLDAGFPYAFDNGNVPAMKEFEALRSPQPAPPSDADRASFNALRKYYQRVLGFTYPEAELRHRWVANPDDSVGKRRIPAGGATLLSHIKKYANIPAPALLIFAHPHSLGRWTESAEGSSGDGVREQAKAYTSAIMALVDRQIKAIESRVPSARVVKLAGANHHVFLSHEADVLREMRAFLGGLR